MREAKDPAALRRILLLGAPRSGTTWVGGILALSPDVEYIFEPDNEKSSILGRCHKSAMPRFPLLLPGEIHPAYSSLWQAAFDARGAGLLSRSVLTRLWLYDKEASERFVLKKEQSLVDARQISPAGPPNGSSSLSFLKRLAALRLNGASSAGVRLVKSVHGVLASEWIEQTASVHHMIVVMRNPYGVLASWRRMRMPDAHRAMCFSPEVLKVAFGDRGECILDELKRELDKPLNQTAFQLAVMYRILRHSVFRNSHWIVIHHEELCLDPLQAFRELFARIGLAWSTEVEAGILSRNREGRGYKSVRVASREPGKWRKDFVGSEMEEIRQVFMTCGLDLGAGDRFGMNDCSSGSSRP